MHNGTPDPWCFSIDMQIVLAGVKVASQCAWSFEQVDCTVCMAALVIVHLIRSLEDKDQVDTFVSLRIHVEVPCIASEKGCLRERGLEVPALRAERASACSWRTKAELTMWR